MPFHRLSASLCVASAFTLSCGGSGSVPDISDASPDADICGCPSAESLSMAIVERFEDTLTHPGQQTFGLGVTCDEGYTQAGISCFLTPQASLAGFVESGRIVRSDLDAVFCRWNMANSDMSHNLHSTLICVESSPPIGIPAPVDGCDCPEAEIAAERILRIEGPGGTIASNAVSTVTSSCDPGQILLSGTCGVEPSDTLPPQENNLRLVSSRRADDSTWSCTWDNPTDTSFVPSAHAYCMRPPTAGTAPERAPLVDRLKTVERTVTANGGSNALADATCESGDFLLSGSCELHEPESHPGITMFRQGFTDDVNRPNTWQCAWYNPTAETAMVTSTALCLSPLPE